MAILDTLSALPPYAYSLRTLTTTYTGPLIAVTRSSDGTSQSFSAVNGSVSVAAIEAFVGSSTGTITTWYNQGSAGSVGNLTVAAPGAFPAITNSSGAVYLAGGLPALYFAADDNNGFVSGTTFKPWSAATSANFVLAVGTSGNWPNLLESNTTSNNIAYLTLDGATLNAVNAGVADIDFSGTQNSVTVNAQSIITVSAPAVSSGAITMSGWINSQSAGTASLSSVTGTPGSGFAIAEDYRQGGASDEYVGTMSEVVLWSSVVSTADREALESNQGSYYGVAGYATTVALVGRGSSTAYARPKLSGSTALKTRASASASGKAKPTGSTLLLGRSQASAQVRSAVSGGLVLAARSLASSFARATIGAQAGLAARSQASSTAHASAKGSAALTGRSATQAQGRGTFAAGLILVTGRTLTTSFGRAVATGAARLAGRSTVVTDGRAGMSASTALAGRTAAASSGHSSPHYSALLVGRAISGAYAEAQMARAAHLTSRITSISYGRGAFVSSNGTLFLTARLQTASRGTGYLGAPVWITTADCTALFPADIAVAAFFADVTTAIFPADITVAQFPNRGPGMSGFSQTPQIPILTGKAPATSRAYGHDFSDQLAPGDYITEIVSVAATAGDGKLVLGAASLQPGRAGNATATPPILLKVSTWISGGTIGQFYTVTATILSAQGVTDQLSFKLPVLAR